MAGNMNATAGWSSFITRPTALTLTMRALLAGILLATAAAGQKKDPNNGVVFLYPTKDSPQVYHTMDTIEVTYTSPFPSPNLYTFCDGGSRQVSMQPVPGYNATVPMLLNFTSATPCWFNLRPGTVPGYGANTANFNIIGQERDEGGQVFGVDKSTSTSTTTTTTTTSTTSTTTTSSVSASSTAAAAETTTVPPSSTTTSSSQASSTSGSGASTPNDNQSQPAADSGASSTTAPAVAVNSGGSDSGLGAAAAGGIGAGVAVGVLAVAGGVFAWLWRRKRRDRMERERGEGDDESRHHHGHGPSGAAASMRSRARTEEDQSVVMDEAPPPFVPSIHSSQERYHGYPKEPYFAEHPQPRAYSPVEIGTSQGLRLKHELPG